MAVISEVIRIEHNGLLSFGDYSSKEKKKVYDFEVNGDLYKVKTHNEITRMEKNGKLLFESVPGAAVHNFKLSEKTVEFTVEGQNDTQVTVELESEKEYKIIIDEVNVGRMKSNMSGKINFSVDLKTQPQNVRIEKIQII